MIRRRHILFIEGYDPQGAEGYYGLFRSACKRFRAVWSIGIELGPLEIQSDDFANWHVDAHAPNWAVAVRYDFLRQERFIRADTAEPMTRHIPRALRWIVGDLVSGALVRIFRASWRFGFALSYFELLLLAWIAVAIAGGLLVAHASMVLLPIPAWGGALAGLAVAVAVFLALRPLADRFMVVQITNHWPRLRKFARGEPTWLDQTIEAGARHLVAAALANETDELVVIGHSGGGVTAPAVVARALELDPDLGRRGPPLVLLTLGSIMPAVALHPAAARMRAIITRLATEPSLTWIDCVSRKDVMNFWDVDPVAGIGVEVGARRCNPMIWRVRFKEAVSPQHYRRLRLSFFRLHFQFIKSGDRRAPYDYLMLVAGPVAIAQWAQNPNQTAAAFAQDGTFTGPSPRAGALAGAGGRSGRANLK